MYSVCRALATLNELPPNSIWRTRSACITLNMPTLVRIEQGPLASCTPEAISGLLSSLAIDSQVASASSPAAADSSIHATASPLSPLAPFVPFLPCLHQQCLVLLHIYLIQYSQHTAVKSVRMKLHRTTNH